MRADLLPAESIQAALGAVLRADQVLIGADERDAYAHDDAEWAEFHRPLTVVLAESTDDVAAVVRLADGTRVSWRAGRWSVCAPGVSAGARGVGAGAAGRRREIAFAVRAL